VFCNKINSRWKFFAYRSPIAYLIGDNADAFCGFPQLLLKTPVAIMAGGNNATHPFTEAATKCPSISPPTRVP
jgi:hypothetical protein